MNNHLFLVDQDNGDVLARINKEHTHLDEIAPSMKATVSQLKQNYRGRAVSQEPGKQTFEDYFFNQYTQKIREKRNVKWQPTKVVEETEKLDRDFLKNNTNFSAFDDLSDSED